MESDKSLPAERCLDIYVISQSPHRYLCYTSPGSHTFDLCVTNVVDMWSTGFTQEKLEEHKSAHGIKTTEEYYSRTRDAFQEGSVQLTVLDNTVTLTLSKAPLELRFHLHQLPISEAKAKIQAAVFHLAEKVCDLEKRLKVSEEIRASTPTKKTERGHRLLLPEVISKRIGSSPTAKRILPGESLINPGRKRTKAPTGVSFEENSP
uniref:Protein PAXX n=1 Tax=Callorhinchus milii TaxID=7868 RepID=V9L427_CALMI